MSEMDSSAQSGQKSELLDYFYTGCEATGAFFGSLHAKILDVTADYIAIGAKGFKKGQEQYMNNISDSYNSVKEKVVNSNEKTDASS
jgi:hypothetical protein